MRRPVGWALVLTALSLGVWLLVSCGGGPSSEGERLFRDNCSPCHGDKGGRIPEIPLDDPGYLFRLGDSGLAQVIAQGKGIMPAWGVEREGPLTADQISTIVDYMLAPDGLTASAGPGRSLYVKNCAQCHGTLGSRIPAAPLNSDAFMAGFDDETLLTVIEQGKESMPAFGKDFGGPLSPEQAGDVLMYVRVLSGGPVEQAEAPAGEVDPGQQVFVSTCATCHGPAGNLIASADLTSPEFLSARSDEDLVTAISEGKGGMPPQGESAGGSLSEDDVLAVVAYLRSAAGVSGGEAAAPPGVLEEAPTGAQELFQSTCSGCHAGLDLPGVDPIRVGEIIRNGLPEEGMPAFGERLSDEEIDGLVRLVASGEAVAATDGTGAAADNPFAGVVRHVDGWISKHPDVVRQQGSQLCQTCHQVTFCADCHTGR
jgi:mono/diheme cytochrome c family protein